MATQSASLHPRAQTPPFPPSVSSRSPNRIKPSRIPSASPLRAHQGYSSARKQSSIESANISKPLPSDPPKRLAAATFDNMQDERRSSSSYSRVPTHNLGRRPSTSRYMLQPRYYNDRKPVDRDSAFCVTSHAAPWTGAVRKEILLPEELRALASRNEGAPVRTMPEGFDDDRQSRDFSEHEIRGRTFSRPHDIASTDEYRMSRLSERPIIKIPAEAERLAKMYHALLRDQSLSSSRDGTSDSDSDSDDDDDDDEYTRTTMRAVPQPLFHNLRHVSKERTGQYSRHLLRADPGDGREPPTMLSALSTTLLYTPLRDDGLRTPLLGRFASPHLHGPKEPGSRLGAIKNIVAGAGASAMQALHARRPSGDGHVDWASLRDNIESMASPERVKRKLQRVVEVGIINDIVEIRKDRARDRKRELMKKMIRVVPNV